MRLSPLSVDEALASLRTGRDGLAPAEAARRLAEFGPNRVEELARESLLAGFARQFSHFFAIVLWVGAALAFLAERYGPGQGMSTLGVAIVGVILVNGVFSFWQEYKAERAVAALRRLLPQTVQVMRGGALEQIVAVDLVPGDVVVLAEGDLVPADCRVIEALGVRVNLATLNGESLPKARTAEPSQEDSPVLARDLLLAGTSLAAGEATAVVYATGMQTEFGHIARLTQAAGEAPSPLRREIARLSWLVAFLAMGLGVAFFLIGQAMRLPLIESCLLAIGIIVANVPEGLLPTVTLSLAMATQRMARRNALVRHLPAVEALGSASVICCDKTGTLTENRMAVKRLLLGRALLEPAALADRPELAARHRQLLLNAALCHNVKANRAGGAAAGDPMEVALAAMGRRAAGWERAVRLDEIPFDTARKRMSVLCDTPEGRVLYCKGALETVLPACEAVEGDAGVTPLDDAERARLLRAEDELAGSGLRVLAFAHAVIGAGGPPTDDRGLTLSGLVGLEDPPRPEVPGAIARCARAGIRVLMVTGDHPRTALAIAREIGLVTDASPRVVTGDELRRLSPAQLQLALDGRQLVFARVSAEQKMTLVEALKKKGEIVAVTGDGVNDAPALKTADIGIAMGLSGTDVAREAADVILLDDNFASIVAAVEEGRSVYENIRKFLTYILTSNIPELVPYLSFVLFGIPLPLTIIQILAVDLGTDMVPALALGAEKPDPAVMTRPPRARKERLLTWGLVARAYLFLGVMEAVAAMAAFLSVLARAGWHRGEALASSDPLYLQATTACLAAIVVMQVVNVFLCRHPRASSLAFGLTGNPLMLAGVAVEVTLILAIVYTRPGAWLFGTAPLGPEVWLQAALFALSMWALDELRKVWARRAGGGRGPERPANGSARARSPGSTP
ncbi:cation-translocating P-type ATPase [Anaeromyxobacter diazotrophicus]|uniref:ATPase n=1 Tax=Anaeromyxobacter diazotrophicus TaxID=2590199 RepID=A0A7I9VHX1_9BACT|nr:cation-transporting P-type ATPase [Anaeromyxobacter diazotrophicus]GEJ55991.1 ATPase [Anaeromyxobacter diazotrophicus]